MSKRVALYIRVSTEEQANSGYSLPEQRRTLEQYAERLGWQIIDVVADEGTPVRTQIAQACSVFWSSPRLVQ
jgi:DNA invertase Pin-like site-specific DNA recombinase